MVKLQVTGLVCADVDVLGLGAAQQYHPATDRAIFLSAVQARGAGSRPADRMNSSGSSSLRRTDPLHAEQRTSPARISARRG
ncbi:hypothetical protein [Kitasatospora sp. NPDC059571]|uniref:hypothetical protein n=1 Tax=Kitasatospora sp. NPDC059571 TaxID=3346871 RepID=UPI00367B95AD